MSERRSTEPGTPRERYALGYGASTHQWMSQRRAATHAAFFLPHLRKGMSLLDCGCGPGSMTLDFAEVVAPGEVTGLDIEPLQIARARAAAEARGIAGCRFCVGDVYALPFREKTFDAVFAHALLYHLQDPLRVIREMHRVLKPGGIVGVRDTDYSVWLLEPVTPALTEVQRLILRVAEEEGASPTYARQQRHLLAEAGFAPTEATASCVSSGTAESIRRASETLLVRLRSESFQAIVISQGWSDPAELARLCLEVERWGERVDAFECLLWRATVGWRSEESRDENTE